VLPLKNYFLTSKVTSKADEMKSKVSDAANEMKETAEATANEARNRGRQHAANYNS